MQNFSTHTTKLALSSHQEDMVLARLFHLLSCPARMRILQILLQSPPLSLSVEELSLRLLLSQPTTSHHLKLLWTSGLIDYCSHGLYKYYFVKTQALETLFEDFRTFTGLLDTHNDTHTHHTDLSLPDIPQMIADE